MRSFRRFEKYRPKKPSNKLEEGTYSKDLQKWRPSIHYKYTLVDIQNQLTPAEYYRSRLLDYGKEIRAIQRLEWRMQKNPSGFLRAATLWQSLYRGYKGRQYYRSVKDDLEAKMLQRQTESLVLELLQKQKKANEEAEEVRGTEIGEETFEFKQEAIDAIEALSKPTIKLLEMRAKIYYTMKNFPKSETASRELLG